MNTTRLWTNLRTEIRSLQLKPRRRLGSGLAVVALWLVASTAEARSNRDFWLLNETGRTITSVQLSPHGWNAWANNVLGVGGALPPFTGSKVVFFFDLNLCNMDIRVGYANGDVEDYVQGRNVCRASAIQFLQNSTNVALVIDLSH